MKEIMLYDGRKMLVRLDDQGISRELYSVGVHEKNCTEFLKFVIQPGWKVLDIGANIGYYTCLEAELVRNEGFVWAVEPVPENFACLQENIKKYNFSNTKVFRLAMGFENTLIKMWTSEIYSNAGTAVKEEEMEYWYIDEFINTKSKKEIIVEQMCIDDFRELYEIPIPDLIRMDVEGYEIDILSGAQKTLAEMPEGSHLFLELHPLIFKDRADMVALIKNLYQHGFVITWEHPKTLDEAIEKINSSEYAIHFFFEKS
jgi:FkbM family methyltransferase